MRFRGFRWHIICWYNFWLSIWQEIPYRYTGDQFLSCHSCRQVGGGIGKNTLYLWNQGHSEAVEGQYMPTVHTSEMCSQHRHDRHTFSRCRLLEDNSSKDESGVCKTQEARDERVQKRSCEIELRGAHLKLDYYNGKQVLLCIQYTTCHWSPACEEWRGTRWYIYMYDEVIYTDIHTYIYILTCIYTYIYIHVYIHTAKFQYTTDLFKILYSVLYTVTY